MQLHNFHILFPTPSPYHVHHPPCSLKFTHVSGLVFLIVYKYTDNLIVYKDTYIPKYTAFSVLIMLFVCMFLGLTTIA